MLPLLSLHALVAHRGDGLRPELLALLQRNTQGQMFSRTAIDELAAANPPGEGANPSETLGGFMTGDDTARRVRDMTIVLDALTARMNAGDAAVKLVEIAADTDELMHLMARLIELNAMDHHVLSVARKLLEANELRVALDRLHSILAWRLADSHI
jgi:hypothetical protein